MVSSNKVAEDRRETAANFRRKYINGLQLECLLARPNSVPVVCTSPVGLRLNTEILVIAAISILAKQIVSRLPYL